MRNCLKTQLKENVNNDNLFKEGEIKIHISSPLDATIAQRHLIINSSDPTIKVRVNGGGYFSTSESGLVTDPKTQDTLTVAGIPINLYFSIGDYDIFIASKYNFTGIQSDAAALFHINLSELKYSSAFAAISLPYCPNVYGDISNFKDRDMLNIMLNATKISGSISILTNMSNLTECQVSETSVTGEIIDLPSKLTVCNIGGTSILGSIESFVEKIISSRNNDSLTFVTNNKVTLNNVAFADNTILNIVFSGTNVTISQATNIIATYDGSTWTYNS